MLFMVLLKRETQHVQGRRAPGFGREVEAGRNENFRADLLLGFPRERQDSVKQLGTSYFE